jgi:hypothetical protein
MPIYLNLDPSPLLRWHLWVAEALEEMPGNEIFRAISAGRRPLHSACQLLFEFERLFYGICRNGAADPMEDALRALPPRPPGEIDLVIDFSGEEIRPVGCRALTPLFNGTPGEVGIMAALANDQDLAVEIHHSGRSSRPWMARPASTDPRSVRQSRAGGKQRRVCAYDFGHGCIGPVFVGLSAFARAPRHGGRRIPCPGAVASGGAAAGLGSLGRLAFA